MGRSLTNNNTITAHGFERQPLPLFGVYSSYNGGPDCTILDSEMNMVSRCNQSTSGQAAFCVPVAAFPLFPHPAISPIAHTAVKTIANTFFFIIFSSLSFSD
jgi:hypothetical protein